MYTRLRKQVGDSIRGGQVIDAVPGNGAGDILRRVLREHSSTQSGTKHRAAQIYSTHRQRGPCGHSVASDTSQIIEDQPADRVPL